MIQPCSIQNIRSNNFICKIRRKGMQTDADEKYQFLLNLNGHFSYVAAVRQLSRKM